MILRGWWLREWQITVQCFNAREYKCMLAWKKQQQHIQVEKSNK